MDGEMGGGLWGVITIVGPILLAAAILFAMLKNRRSRAEKLRSERAVRDQHNAQRRAEGVPEDRSVITAEGE